MTAWYAFLYKKPAQEKNAELNIAPFIPYNSDIYKKTDIIYKNSRLNIAPFIPNNCQIFIKTKKQILSIRTLGLNIDLFILNNFQIFIKTK